MSVKIQIIKNEVKPAIEKLVRKLRDPSAALRKLGILEVSQTKLRFRREQNPAGEQWQPLDSNTIRQKNSAVILRKSGILRSSINYAVQGTSRLFIGTNVKYGKFHQEGKGVPERQFLGVNQQTRRNAETVMRQFLGF